MLTHLFLGRVSYLNPRHLVVVRALLNVEDTLAKAGKTCLNTAVPGRDMAARKYASLIRLVLSRFRRLKSRNDYLARTMERSNQDQRRTLMQLLDRVAVPREEPVVHQALCRSSSGLSGSPAESLSEPLESLFDEIDALSGSEDSVFAEIDALPAFEHRLIHMCL